MSQRMWLAGIMIAMLGGIPLATAQSVLEPPGSMGQRFPFSQMPSRMPGPPVAEGELPLDLRQSPSTQPGRVSRAPIAEGIMPDPARPADLPRMSNPLAPLPNISTYSELRSTTSGLRFLSPLGPLPEVGAPPSELPSTSVMDELAEVLVPGVDPELFATPFLPPVPSQGSLDELGSLRLGQVLATAERTYPPYVAALQERGIASGNVLSALGVFDLNFNLNARNWGMGYYKRFLYDATFEQQTGLWGTKFFAGYRLAAGDWPPYYQYFQTNGGGAYLGGFELPILRGGRIDPARALLYQTEIDRRRVEPDISKQRITLFNAASKVYWRWLAAGRVYVIYVELLQLAVDRNEGIRSQVEKGSLAEIELVDNERVILQRQSLVVAARRRFQQAAIELSLYVRDGYGMPMIPDVESLPSSFPTVETPRPERLPEDLEVALRLRPEVLELRLLNERTVVDRELARNQMLPGLNFYLYAEQNVGSPVPLRNKQPFILESSFLFDVPLQRRQARGRIQAADSRLRQIQYQTRFAADRITADVKDSLSSLLASYELLDQARRTVRLNQRLEDAERLKFEKGASTILFVNLREQNTADTEVSAVEAEERYYVDIANYRASLGVDALPNIR